MSHYVAGVFLHPTDDVEKSLSVALEPFNENAEVDEYRRYLEEKTPEDHWYFKPIQEEFSLLDNISWEDYVEFYNQKFGDEKILLDSTGPYELSTYNPQSQWDWYSIGGRWNGMLFVKDEYLGNPAIIHGRPGTMGEMSTKPGCCDGAPLKMLDFTKMEKDARDEADTRWKEFFAIAGGLLEVTKSWEEVKKLFPDINEARSFYHEQELLKKLNQVRHWYDDPVKEFSCTNEEYLNKAAVEIGVGFSTLTLEGEWIEPSKMGWFGMYEKDEDKRMAYKEKIREYMTAIPEDTIYVYVDCHI